MTRLDSFLDWSKCDVDLNRRPQSWEDLMILLALGAIYIDQIGDVAFECADVADQGEPCFPTWEDAVMEALLEGSDEFYGDASQTLIACGRAADEVEAAARCRQ